MNAGLNRLVRVEYDPSSRSADELYNVEALDWIQIVRNETDKAALGKHKSCIPDPSQFYAFADSYDSDQSTQSSDDSNSQTSQEGIGSPSLSASSSGSSFGRQDEDFPETIPVQPIPAWACQDSEVYRSVPLNDGGDGLSSGENAIPPMTSGSQESTPQPSFQQNSQQQGISYATGHSTGCPSVQQKKQASEVRTSRPTVTHNQFPQIPYRPRTHGAIQNEHIAGQKLSLVPATETQQAQNVETSSNRRRGCSIGSTCLPPKLRRDTDNTDTIVKMIVIFCTNLINSIWPHASLIGADAVSSIPGSNVLPLQVFITETLRRSKTSYSTLQIALYYLILLKQCLPGTTAPEYPGASGCRAMQCGRRMFLTALILASKYLQDRNYSARAWSKISGLPMDEINQNERRYLNVICWDLHVRKETFENWSKIVLAICRLSTDQDLGRKGFNDQGPPSPGLGVTLQQSCPLKNVSRNLSALRNWWMVNLKGLRTDIVGCPRKTDNYLLSIAPFRDGAFLARPVFATSSDEVTQYQDSDKFASSRIRNCLPRLPSIDRLNKCFQSQEPASSPTPVTGLPAPPMLRNLPTPQTTPRADLSNMWNMHTHAPNATRSRCRASASALGAANRSAHLLANLERCPPPKPQSSQSSQSSQRSWSEYDPRPPPSIPDRSLTSSPESVISDASSFSFINGRSRSSSISSQSSFSTTSSDWVMDCDPREKQLTAMINSAQSNVAPPRERSLPRRCVRGALPGIERPKTAFRLPDGAPSTCRLGDAREPVRAVKSYEDEGYGSNDEGERHQLAAHCRESELESEKRVPAHHQGRNLQRSQTQVFNPRQENVKPQLLKRARSESLDMAQESYFQMHQANVSNRHSPWNVQQRRQQQQQQQQQQHRLSVPSDCLLDNPVLGSAKNLNIQQPHQLWATPRKPVQCGAQSQNKRMAVQPPCVAAAAELAARNLRSDILVG